MELRINYNDSRILNKETIKKKKDIYLPFSNGYEVNVQMLPQCKLPKCCIPEIE